MERGLIWLPLLAIFIWLAWAGWNEYGKLEAYNAWAAEFEKAKFDIYAVLGKKGRELTWGKPTRQGPVDLNTFSLDTVSAIALIVDGKRADMEEPPPKGQKIALEFALGDAANTLIQVPFTEIALAVAWGKYLQGQLSSEN